MDVLLDQGDLLDVPRKVRHRLHFDDADARARCLSAAAVLGFSGSPATDVELVLTRMDCVELEHIHAVSSTLRVLAREHGGIYGGWSCAPQYH